MQMDQLTANWPTNKTPSILAPPTSILENIAGSPAVLDRFYEPYKSVVLDEEAIIETDVLCLVFSS